MKVEHDSQPKPAGDQLVAFVVVHRRLLVGRTVLFASEKHAKNPSQNICM